MSHELSPIYECSGVSILNVGKRVTNIVVITFRWYKERYHIRNVHLRTHIEPNRTKRNTLHKEPNQNELSYFRSWKKAEPKRTEPFGRTKTEPNSFIDWIFIIFFLFMCVCGIRFYFFSLYIMSHNAYVICC